MIINTQDIHDIHEKVEQTLQKDASALHEDAKALHEDVKEIRQKVDQAIHQDANMDFFQKNEHQVSARICKILLWLTIVFPVLGICSLIGIFAIKLNELAIIAVLGLICTVSPTILFKKNVNGTFIKYYSIIALALTIALMASNSHIGIYLTYPLAVAMSCMYYDKKFTQRTAIIGYICMVGGMAIRATNVEIYNDISRLRWFIAYTLGYTIEYVAMSAIFISSAKHSRQLLEKLNVSEHVSEVLNKCENAAGTLSTTMTELNSTMESSFDCNNQIEEQAQKTIESCKTNLDAVKKTDDSIRNMNENMEEISQRADEMYKIAEDTMSSTKDYIRTMDNVQAAVDQIGDAGETIRNNIDKVNGCMAEINGFTQTISGIATRTNMLSLNATIEAARAGEHGKGFAVVAEQVAKLAKECQNATQSISSQVKAMETEVNEAIRSVGLNREKILAGEEAIKAAKEGAESILSLQNESTVKVQEVQSNLNTVILYQKEVAAIASEMDIATSETLSQAEKIQEIISIQSESENIMKTAFNKVQNVSDELLEIANQG